MKSTEYVAFDGVGIAELIRRREVSKREVAEAAIRVIEERNGDLNAVICKNFDALETISGSESSSPLDGVPFLLKDANLFSSDMPTTFGSAFFKGTAAQPDSIMVDRWRKAGLVILGKTNTPEFAAEFVTEPQAYGVTHNPAAPGLTVGGSSGGAASAVAAGMVPIAHATDLGGSIRIPAACCGVFGFKPTSGLNPVGPYFKKIAGGLNSDHVVTRTVRDSAASLDVTANERPKTGSFLSALHAPIGSLRIGVSERDPSGRIVGPDQRLAVNQTAKMLEEMGHSVSTYAYPDDLSAEWFDYLWIFDIVDLVEQRTDQLGRKPEKAELEPLTWHLLEKARSAGRRAYDEAQEAKAFYTSRYLASMQHIDILLTPTLAEDPPETGALSFKAFGDVERWNSAGYGFAPFSTPSNLSGQPSASCPWLKNASGLSIGVQINGKPGADILVLQLAAQLERAHQELA